MYPRARQTVTKKHQELNFRGSCDPGVRDKVLASYKPNLVSEQTWMSKTSNGIKKKKNPDSDESLIKNHKKKYYEMYHRINLVLANRLQLLPPRSNIL